MNTQTIDHKITDQDWIIINNKKYDIREFKKRHPGGEYIIACYAGMDASDVFHEFHENVIKTRHILSTLPVIGMVPGTIDNSSFDDDIRALRIVFEQEGKFLVDPYFYIGKCIELLCLFSSASLLLKAGWWFTSSATMGLFFQQAGWLSHDIAHNQVTQSSREFRTSLLGIFGNLCQGFSGSWWIKKHMLHHAMPNAIHEKTNKAVEEDFDTAPLLYWTSRLFPSKDGVPPWYTRWQGYYLWLVLPWSKFFWDYQSIQTSIVSRAWSESFLIVLHYMLLGLHVWILQPSIAPSVFTIPSLSPILWYMLMSRLWGGFLISWVFIQSHNGMTYYDRKTLGFYEAQAVSTRNMSLDKWTTWFTGGLNYQIEHHLFPTMPRHHLPSIADKIQTIFRIHNIPYITSGILKCTKFLTSYLNKLGREKPIKKTE